MFKCARFITRGNSMNRCSLVVISALTLMLGGCRCGTEVATPAAIAIEAGADQAGPVGTALPAAVTVRVTSSSGAAVAAVAVTFSASAGGSVGTASAVTDADGRATTTWTLGPTAGPQHLTATAAGVTSPAVANATATTTVVPTLSLRFARQPVVAVAAEAFTPAPQVSVVDAQGLVVQTFTGSISVALMGGAMLEGTTTVNALAGVATFNDLKIMRAAAGYQLVASSSGLADVTSDSFAVSPGPATTLAFTRQPQGTTVATVLSPAPQVSVLDARGNTVTGFIGTIALTLTGSGTLEGTATLAPVAGVATFDTLTIGQVGTGYQLVAAATGLTSATSDAFAMSPGQAALLVLASGAGQTAGVNTTLAQPIVVRVTDSRGNPLAAHSVTFSTDLDAGFVAPTNASTDVAGLAQASWTLGPVAGTQVLTARSGALSPLTVSAIATAAASDAGTLVFSSISAGAIATCGITTADAGYCWGWNSSAQLATGDFVNHHTPIAMTGGLQFKEISVGFPQACGVSTSGAAYCWGSNTNGGLGQGPTPAFTQTPLPVSGGLTFASVSTGQLHSCGLTTAGAAWCWGNNDNGGLGDGTMNQSNVPVAVSGGLTFASVKSGGSYNCGVTTTGAGYCWGGNGYGVLGNGSFTDSMVPVPVSGGLTFSQISPAQSDFTCGLTTAGVAWCWGFNGNLELGRAGGLSNVPVQVNTTLTFTSITTGNAHSCALTAAGAAWCWGGGGSGALGNNSVANSAAPVAVLGGLTFASISAGISYTCGVTTNHEAWCWGNSHGSGAGSGPASSVLGDGLLVDSWVPVKVSGQP
jgi:alpha-tubulin suppressor-like RCC1 family protein